jgi:hypothetical protein
MSWFRKWLILTHRYLGIGLSLLFVMWFASGIGIMYTQGMPSLTSEIRFERLPALNLARVRVSPSQALENALWGVDPDGVSLLMVMDRPAYRIGGAGESLTVFADTGEILASVSEEDALTIAASFMELPAGRMEYGGLMTRADQWTISLRREMPLHKIVVHDASRSELYVSEHMGEVVLMTTRGSRIAAWAAAIPHWLYFAPLRLNDGVWRQVVIGTAGLGCLLALIGIVVGVMQYSPARPFRLSKAFSYIPYKGWMRWHYLTGMVFGVFTLTWVFSGMLSMEPLFWSSRGGGLGAGMRQAFAGGSLDMTLFPSIDASAWDEVLVGRSVKEIEFRRIQGDPYFLVRDSNANQSLLRSNPLEFRYNAFSIESLMDRIRSAYPQVEILESRLTSRYDSYYYPRGGSSPPLPVLRIKFDDPAKTWFYVDPAMGQLVGRYHRLERLERWLYNGLHSLDFGFWYYNESIWRATIIVLSAGGIGTSAIGMFLGFRRVARGLKRRMPSYPSPKR